MQHVKFLWFTRIRGASGETSMVMTKASMRVTVFLEGTLFVTLARYVNISSPIASHNNLKRPDLLESLFHFLIEDVSKEIYSRM